MGHDHDATVEVILDIFSGRPNPSWKLSHHQIAELRRLLEASRRERRDEGREPPGLGYRGFIIANRSQVHGIPYRVQVYGGVLTITETFAEGPVRPVYYADAQRMEDWLLRQATEQGHAEDIAAMGGPPIR